MTRGEDFSTPTTDIAANDIAWSQFRDVHPYPSTMYIPTIQRCTSLAIDDVHPCRVTMYIPDLKLSDSAQTDVLSLGGWE